MKHLILYTLIAVIAGLAMPSGALAVEEVSVAGVPGVAPFHHHHFHFHHAHRHHHHHYRHHHRR